jgi:GntR family transcriptional regulator
VSIVDRGSPLPVYFQIALDLRRRLEAGEWATGERIAAETALADEYDVSRVTIRQALAELVKDDLLERHRGSGTFVRDRPRPLIHDLSLPLVYVDRLQELGFTNTADVLEAGVLDHPDDEQRLALALQPGAGVAYLVRRIRLNDEPTAIYRSWFDAELVPGIQRSRGISGSLARTLADEYGLSPASSENRLEVVRSTQEEAALLGADVHAPLLVVTSTTYLGDGRPLEHSQTSWLGDRVRFHVSGHGESGVRRQAGATRPPGRERRARSRRSRSTRAASD